MFQDEWERFLVSIEPEKTLNDFVNREAIRLQKLAAEHYQRLSKMHEHFYFVDGCFFEERKIDAQERSRQYYAKMRQWLRIE